MLKYLLFETPFMLFADIMVAVWVVLLALLRRMPVGFFTIVLGVDLVLFVVGAVAFVRSVGEPHPRGSDLFGLSVAVISIANFATGLTCCALLAALTLLGEAIMQKIRNRLATPAHPPWRGKDDEWHSSRRGSRDIEHIGSARSHRRLPRPDWPDLHSGGP
jgi:hypothetical protein